MKEPIEEQSKKDFHKNIGVLMLNGLWDVANTILKSKAEKEVEELLEWRECTEQGL